MYIYVCMYIYIYIYHLQYLGRTSLLATPSRHSSLKREILFIEARNNQVHSSAGLVIGYFEGFQRGFSDHWCSYQRHLNESEAPIIATK